MDVLEIPFVNKVGIVKNQGGRLSLDFVRSNQNHVQTVHASAQFALAETASGDMLQALFPELEGDVVPVLRSSEIKFKKPAVNAVFAYPAVTDEDVLKFEEQLAKKGRALLSVGVELRDEEEQITCSGVFNWFVQRMR